METVATTALWVQPGAATQERGPGWPDLQTAQGKAESEVFFHPNLLSFKNVLATNSTMQEE